MLNIYNNAPSIPGLKISALAKPASSASLGGKLRINNALSNQATEKKPLNAATPPDLKTTLSDHAKFANEFSVRCRQAADGDKKAADLLTDSFMALSKEIASQLGQDEADKFQSAALKATEHSFNKGNLVAAVTIFFSEKLDQAKTETDLDLFGKLIDFQEFLNQGLDIAIDEENILAARLADGETPGVAYALNKFFHTPSQVAADMESVETMGFEQNFQWTEMRVFKRMELTDGPFGLAYYCYVNTGQSVTAEGLAGSDSLQRVSDFLTNEIGNDQAAFYLNNLSASSNVMEALATTVAIVVKESGADKAEEYVSFLNANLKSEINSTLESGLKFEGWQLTLANQNTALSANSLPHKPLSLSGASDILNKGHDALEVNWRNANGVGVITPGKDLDSLYSAYANSIAFK